jgi:hypothetical protein
MVVVVAMSFAENHLLVVAILLAYATNTLLVLGLRYMSLLLSIFLAHFLFVLAMVSCRHSDIMIRVGVVSARLNANIIIEYQIAGRISLIFLLLLIIYIFLFMVAIPTFS